MQSGDFCSTSNPSETIRLVTPPLPTAPSYFTSLNSTELTDKIIHWFGYIGTIELKQKLKALHLSIIDGRIHSQWAVQ